MNFNTQLIQWYKTKKRDLPWRNTKDPYKIWLSEIILQQTRVNQGLPYYFAFTEKFPSVKHLASTSIDEVYKLWQGLGYYSRAKNLHLCANQIVNEFNGKFPEDMQTLKKLKGIGDYTAAAISSFAFEKANAVVDGNVYRFLSRLYGINTPVPGNKAFNEFFVLANSLMQDAKPSVFNQALMEFGAVQCKPAPDCETCIFRQTCFAFNNKSVAKFPVKLAKSASKNRYFYYLLIKAEQNNILIEKRENKDIWQNLFQFPLIESTAELSLEQLDYEIRKLTENICADFAVINFNFYQKHILTHQNIHAYFYGIKPKTDFLKIPPKYLLFDIEQFSQYAFPRLITKNNEFLKKFALQL